MDTKIRGIFEENVVKAGRDEALGYGDGGQPIRLGAAARLINNLSSWGEGTPRILDVGCGYADLYEYLKKPCDYVGIDTVEWIAEYARGRYPDATVLNTDLSAYAETIRDDSEKADIVVSLGVHACLTEDQDEAYTQLLFRSAKKGGHVVISFPDADLYSGTFHGRTMEYMSRLVGHTLTEENVIRTTKIHVTFAVPVGV